MISSYVYAKKNAWVQMYIFILNKKTDFVTPAWNQ